MFLQKLKNQTPIKYLVYFDVKLSKSRESSLCSHITFETEVGEQRLICDLKDISGKVNPMGLGPVYCWSGWFLAEGGRLMGKKSTSGGSGREQKEGETKPGIIHICQRY